MSGVKPISVLAGAAVAVVAFLLGGGETVAATLFVGIIGAAAILLWELSYRVWGRVFRDR